MYHVISTIMIHVYEFYILFIKFLESFHFGYHILVTL